MKDKENKANEFSFADVILDLDDMFNDIGDSFEDEMIRSFSDTEETEDKTKVDTEVSDKEDDETFQELDDLDFDMDSELDKGTLFEGLTTDDLLADSELAEMFNVQDTFKGGMSLGDALQSGFVGKTAEQLEIDTKADIKEEVSGLVTQEVQGIDDMFQTLDDSNSVSDNPWDNLFNSSGMETNVLSVSNDSTNSNTMITDNFDGFDLFDSDFTMGSFGGDILDVDTIEEDDTKYTEPDKIEGVVVETHEKEDSEVDTSGLLSTLQDILTDMYDDKVLDEVTEDEVTEDEVTEDEVTKDEVQSEATINEKSVITKKEISDSVQKSDVSQKRDTEERDRLVALIVKFSKKAHIEPDIDEDDDIETLGLKVNLAKLAYKKYLRKLQKEQINLESQINQPGIKNNTPIEHKDTVDVVTVQKDEIQEYSEMSIETLYKEVKYYLVSKGVQQSLVPLDDVITKFGKNNIKRLRDTNYVIILRNGITLGKM